MDAQPPHGPLRKDPTRISTRSSFKDLCRITQGPLGEEFSRISTRTHLQWKCRRPRAGKPCAVQMHMDMSTNHFMQEFSGQILRPNIVMHTLCESAQWKCTWTCHNNNFMRELTGKNRKPDGAPWSSTGLFSHRKNPSVWTHCRFRKTNSIS